MFLTYCLLPMLLFGYRDGHALPVSRTWTSNTTFVPVLEIIDSTNQQQSRTLFGVTWSCLLTVFICAWTSVHPNVPPRGLMGGLLARVKLMFWTIVAPELVLAWAVRQWFGATEIKNVYNQHRGNRPSKVWTMAHGHFLEMGGFRLVSDKLHQLKEPEEPGWLSMTADLDPYTEYVMKKDRCQLGTLTLERFKELVVDPDVAFPAITAAQIHDRSKGDGLTKLVAIIQTSWFILQCIARGFQGLALTEMELVTLAMASLNAITFAFWWNKPLSVQEPVDVYVTVQGGVAEKVAHNNVVDEDEENFRARDVTGFAWNELVRLVSFIFHPLSQGHRTFKYRDYNSLIRVPGLYLVLLPICLFSVLSYPVFLLFPLGITFLLWLIETEKGEKPQDDDTIATRVVLSLRRLRYNLTHSIRLHFGSRNGPLRPLSRNYQYQLAFIIGWFFIIPASFFLLLLVLLVLSPLFAIFLLASLTFTAAFEIVTTNKVRPGATHVPAFYAPRTHSDKYSRMIVFAIFGVIFGGIHIIAWNFAFPTHSERWLWRYTSLILTVIPFVVAPIDCIVENVKMNGTVGKKFRLLLAIFMTALLFLYVPARISLIAQALALLRDQPASAYVAVDWTKYIPHLFS